MKSLSFVKNEFEKDGYTLLTTEYKKGSQKLEFVCPKGHQHSISWDQWKAGQRCRPCGILRRADKQRFSIDKIKAEIEKDGYKLLSGVYKGANEKLDVCCSLGHHYQTTWARWSYGGRCPVCKCKTLAKKQSIGVEIVKQSFEKEGYVLLSKEYKNRTTNLEYICPVGHKGTITWSSWNRGSRCNRCGYDRVSKKLGQPFAVLQDKVKETGFSIIDSYYGNNKDLLKFKCPENHEFLMCYNNFQQGHRCPICAKHKSQAETEIHDFLKQFFPDIVSGDRQIIKPLELDIVIPSKMFAIEYCGLYWHSEAVGKDDTYHINKLNMCNEKGYRLITVFEDEYIHHKEVVLNTLLAKLGVSKAEKVNARDCEIRVIDTATASDFCNKFHLQGYTGASIKLGAFLGTKLLSVMTFSKPSVAKGGKAEDGVFELSRFCSDFQFRLVGGAGKLLKHFCRGEKPQQVFTYADRRWSDGTLYEKIGFQKIHETKPNYWYVVDDKRHHRFNFRKSELVEFPNYSSDKTEMQIMDEAGFGRMYDCGNLKYVYSYH